MNSLNEFLKVSNGLVADLFAKVEEAKQHMTAEQRADFDKQLKEATNDIKTATELMKAIKL